MGKALKKVNEAPKRKLQFKIFTEKDFENLFSELLNLVIERGDYGNSELFQDICYIYEIEEYIIDIQYIQKKSKVNIFEIIYSGDKVDCEKTLASFYNFFVLFNTLKEYEQYDLIDRESISQITIPSIERVLSYCRKEK